MCRTYHTVLHKSENDTWVLHYERFICSHKDIFFLRDVSVFARCVLLSRNMNIYLLYPALTHLLIFYLVLSASPPLDSVTVPSRCSQVPLMALLLPFFHTSRTPHLPLLPSSSRVSLDHISPTTRVQPCQLNHTSPTKSK
mgnify:CR=1 FL=1